jgi:hypothetical protein
MISSIDFNATFAGLLIKETTELTTGLTKLTNGSINTYFKREDNKYKLLTERYDKEAYLYDIIVILKFYAIIHRLFWYHLNITLKNDENEFKTFIKKAKLKFTKDSSNCRIENNEIILNNLFNLDSLKLDEDNVDYNFIYNINPEIIGIYDKKFEIKYVPLYHNFNKDTKIFTKFQLLNNFMTNDYNTIYKINIENKTSDDKYIINFPNKINKILVENAIFTSKIIYEYYKYFNGLNDNTYTNQRRIIYLYVFNDILNINNTDIIKQMYTYNKILYNALIQYECYNYYHYATTLPINIQLSLILNSIYNDISPLFQNRNLNVNNRLNNFELLFTLKTAIPSYINTLNELKDSTRSTNLINYINDIIIIIQSIYNINQTLQVKQLGFTPLIDSFMIHIPSESYSFHEGDNMPQNLPFSFNNIIKPAEYPFHHGYTLRTFNNRISSRLIGSNYDTSGRLDITHIDYYIILYKLTTPDHFFYIHYKHMYIFLSHVINYIASKKTDYDNIIYNITRLYEIPYNLNTLNTLDNISNFNDNLRYIIKYYNDIFNYNIGDKKFTTYKDKLDFKDFNNNMQTFEDISNKYKNEWNIYNKGLYYYRILLFISIILFISIVIISNININNNTIILIFIIKIILILTLILFIYKKPKKEHFTLSQLQPIYETLTQLPEVSSSFINKYSLYAQTITKYDEFVLSNKLDLKLDSDEYKSEYILNLNKNLHLKFDDTIINDYNEKLEYYKVKSIDLYNSITTLKKTNVINYYIILIIYVSFIFLIIGLICLMIYPNNLYSIIISLSIIFIIILTILFIKLHKNTNMDNDKNYWSNFNPSDNLKYNDDGLT